MAPERPTISPMGRPQPLRGHPRRSTESRDPASVDRRCEACGGTRGQTRMQAPPPSVMSVVFSQDLPANAVEPLPSIRFENGRTGTEFHLIAREVVVIEIRSAASADDTEQAPAWHGSPGAAGKAQGMAGLELYGHQHHGAAARQSGQKADQGGVRIQRRGDPSSLTQACSLSPGQLSPAHAVRLHDTLRRAGGARGIDDVERLFGRDRHFGRRGPSGAEPGRRTARPRRCRRARRAASPPRRRSLSARRPVSRSSSSSLAPLSFSIIVEARRRRGRLRAARPRPPRRGCRRRPPRNCIEVRAQIATTPPLPTPSRCTANAMRSISAASAAIGQRLVALDRAQDGRGVRRRGRG